MNIRLKKQTQPHAESPANQYPIKIMKQGEVTLRANTWRAIAAYNPVVNDSATKIIQRIFLIAVGKQGIEFTNQDDDCATDKYKVCHPSETFLLAQRCTCRRNSQHRPHVITRVCVGIISIRCTSFWHVGQMISSLPSCYTTQMFSISKMNSWELKFWRFGQNPHQNYQGCTQATFYPRRKAEYTDIQRNELGQGNWYLQDMHK